MSRLLSIGFLLTALLWSQPDGAQAQAGTFQGRLRVLSGPATFYLRPLGSDTNCTGLTNADDPGSGSIPRSCAWQTIAGARDKLCTKYDFNHQIVTVQLTATTAGTEINCRPANLAGASHWIFRGDPANPHLIVVQAGSGAYALAATGNAAWTADGLTFRNAAGNQDLIAVAAGSDVIVKHARFGPLQSPSPWNHITVYPRATFTVPNGTTHFIEGGAQTHVYCAGFCFYPTDGHPNLINIGFTASAFFSVGFAYANGSGQLHMPAINFQNKSFATGPRFYAEFGGTIYVASNVQGAAFSNAYDYLPGNVNGTTTSNANYVTNAPKGLRAVFGPGGQVVTLVSD